MPQHILYYEIMAYICDPQPGELGSAPNASQSYSHTSGPIYIVENGVHREVEVGDCFWSPAQNAQNSGVLNYNVKWKTLTRSLSSFPQHAGPRQHAICCDYWVCPNPGSISPNPCIHIMGNPPSGSIWYTNETTCISQCAGDPGGFGEDFGYSPDSPAIGTTTPTVGVTTTYGIIPTLKPALPITDPTISIGSLDCLNTWTCPCGYNYHPLGSLIGHNYPNGEACTSPDFGWQDPITGAGPGSSQIMGTRNAGCITIDGVLPLLNDAIPLIHGGSTAPGVSVSNGPVGAANGGYITHDSSYVVRTTLSTSSGASYWNSVICNSMFPYTPYSPTPQNKKIINSFILDNSTISEIGEKKSFIVSGDSGAIFSLTVKNSAGKYYNFTTNAFQTAAVKLAQQEIDFTGIFNSSIIFPTITSNDTYDIELFSEVGHNTFLSKDAIFNSGADTIVSNELLLKKTIIQSVNTTITFSLRSPSNSAYYSALPANVTSTLPPSTVLSSNGKVDFSWDVALSSRNFSLTRQPVLTDFEIDRSDIYTTNGTGSSATALILDDISRLETGMALTAVESGSVSGSPVINSINTTTKTVTLSVAQSWADDKEITFTDTGYNGFHNFFDSSSSFILPKATIADVTTTTSTDTTGSPSAVVAVASANGLKISITQTVDGDATDSKIVTLNSITGLWIGQYLVNISSGMVNKAIKIIGVDTDTKKVTFDTTLTVADTVTLTFANTIVSGIDIVPHSDYPNVPVYISNISTLNLTTSATQAIESGVTLTFKGNSRSATITGTMTVEEIGETDFTTYLNLDNILYVTA